MKQRCGGDRPVLINYDLWCTHDIRSYGDNFGRVRWSSNRICRKLEPRHCTWWLLVISDAQKIILIAKFNRVTRNRDNSILRNISQKRCKHEFKSKYFLGTWVLHMVLINFPDVGAAKTCLSSPHFIGHNGELIRRILTPYTQVEQYEAQLYNVRKVTNRRLSLCIYWKNFYSPLIL